MFDCKCKNLKKTRRRHKTNKHKDTYKQTEQLEEKHKKNRNTGYPAHEPPRINRTNYSRRFVGWIYCISVFSVFFSLSFSVVLCFFMFCCLCFRLVFLSFCIYNRTITYTNIKQKQKHSKKNRTTEQTKKTEISQPEPERYLFVVGSRAGYPVFMCFCFFEFSFVCCLFLYVFLLFNMFSPSLFQQTHITTNKNNNKLEEQQKHINKKIKITQPEPERYLFAVGSRAGYPVFLFCLFFLFFFVVFLLLVSVCYVFA